MLFFGQSLFFIVDLKTEEKEACRSVYVVLGSFVSCECALGLILQWEIHKFWEGSALFQGLPVCR